MEGKIGKTYEEIQLDFAFVVEAANAPATLAGNPRFGRTHRAARSQGMGKALTSVQAALLDASLEELNEHLLALFEFCEAAMTRALDLVPLRKGALFSAEELRSLRGVGQAQWLLTEASAKREMQATIGKARKSKKRTNAE